MNRSISNTMTASLTRSLGYSRTRQTHSLGRRLVSTTPQSSTSPSSLPSSSSSPPPSSQENQIPSPSTQARPSPLYAFLMAGCIFVGGYYFLPNNAAKTKRLVSGGDPSLRLDTYKYNQLIVSDTVPYPSTSEGEEHRHIKVTLPLGSSTPVRPSSEETDQSLLRIRSIYIKEPALQIERAYTPLYDTLPGTTSIAVQQQSTDYLDLLIKRYPDGELSRYAHRLQSGDKIEVRGPEETWNFSSVNPSSSSSSSNNQNVPDEIVMVVGGTGVTPAYQLVTSVLGRPGFPNHNNLTTSQTKLPKLTLLYAVRSLSSSLLLPQLYQLARDHPDKFEVALFTESLDSFPAAVSTLTVSSSLEQPGLPLLTVIPCSSTSWWPIPIRPLYHLLPSLFSNSLSPGHFLFSSTSKSQIPIYHSRINQQHIQSLSPSPTSSNSVLVLVCGPDGMVHQIAGPKDRDGIHQGRLSGFLAKLGFSSSQVVKL